MEYDQVTESHIDNLESMAERFATETEFRKAIATAYADGYAAGLRAR